MNWEFWKEVLMTLAVLALSFTAIMLGIRIVEVLLR